MPISRPIVISALSLFSLVVSSFLIRKINKLNFVNTEQAEKLRLSANEITKKELEIGHKEQEIELIRKNADNYKDQLSEMEERMELKFENLSNKIMDESISKIEENSSKSIGNVLSPLKERINNFQQKIETLYTEEAKERHSLKNEIRSISEIGNQLNQDALNLTKALKGDVKAQGNWGEMVLEKILENSA